jgi:hypothetical protein
MDFKSKRKIFLLLAFSLLTFGCDSVQEVQSMSNDYQALELPVQNVYVAVNDLPSDLKRKNPIINKYFPADDVEWLLFSAGLDSGNVIYDDTDIKFNVCANSFDIDGYEKSQFPNRVSVIGIRGCHVFSNDYKTAIKYTESLIEDFEKRNPHAIRIDMWLNHASIDDLNRFYGTNSERTRNIFSPITSTEAEMRFSRLAEKINSIKLPDDSEFNSYVVLAVFEGKNTTFTIGIYTQKEYGGDNLDFPKEHAIRYAVSAAFERKNYEGSVFNNPIKWSSSNNHP